MTTEPKISKVVREIEMSYDEGREIRVTGGVYLISMVLIDMDIIRRDYHLEPIFL